MVYLFYVFLRWVNVKALKDTGNTEAFDSAEQNPVGMKLLLRVKQLVSGGGGVSVPRCPALFSSLRPPTRYFNNSPSYRNEEMTLRIVK